MILKKGKLKIKKILSAAEDDDKSATVAATEEAAAKVTELHSLRACYTCKARYRQLHHFYAQLCPACAALATSVVAIHVCPLCS